MKIVFCTGAGSSAEANIPMFRGSDGLWENHHIDEICNIHNFQKNYNLVHEFYNKQRELLKSVTPTIFHQQIAKYENNHNAAVITSNVDDLLERGNCNNVVHIHGKLTEVITEYKSKNQKVTDIGYANIDYSRQLNVKPNVVFFYEDAPLYNSVYKQFKSLNATDIVVVVGSSEEVFPFVSAARIVSKFKGKILFVNPDLELCLKQRALYNVEFYHGTACQFAAVMDKLLQ